MPQQEWRVTLSNGDIVTVRSDKEPTMDEVMKAMRRSDDPKPAQLKTDSSTAPASSGSWSERMLDDTLGAVKDVATGVVKGAGTTAAGFGEMMHRIPGFSEGTDMLLDQAPGWFGTSNPNGPTSAQAAFDMARDATTARNRGESIGKGVEQAAEYLIPATAAAKAVPLARGAVPATRLLARMGTEAALTAPLAQAHGENPVVAGGVAAALPAVGKTVLEPLGRGFITRVLKPTKEHLRQMTGGARAVADKTARIVDTAIEHRIMGEGGAAEKIGTRMDEIDDIFAGPAGDNPANIHLRLPQAVDDLKNYYQGGVPGEPGVAMPRGGVAAANDIVPEVLEGVLGKANPPPVNLPAGMQSSWPMRALRDDVSAREAYAVAKRQSLENAKIPFGEHGTPGSEARKKVEMTLRNAAKDAADIPAGGTVPPNNLKPLFGEVSDLVDVRKAAQNAPADMPRTAAGEVVAGTSMKANLAMRLIRALGLPAGQATHIAGEAMQNENLMRALIEAGFGSATGENR